MNTETDQLDYKKLKIANFCLLTQYINNIVSVKEIYGVTFHHMSKTGRIDL